MNKYVHLIGIGGIGMSGIAQLFLRKGIRVSGSDLKENKILGSLRKLGAEITIGHNASSVKDQDLVVYSSAIKENNPELRKAKDLKIKVVKRAQALAELMSDETVITVTGAHGKTTTAGLIAHILIQAGLAPTVAIGGIACNWENNVCLGGGKFFVIEADESDGSFLYYKPDYSVITNLDCEHFDYYKSFPRLLDTFRNFLKNTKEGGCVFASADDQNLKNLLKDCRKKSFLFGLSKAAEVYAENIKFNGLTSDFDCFRKNDSLGRFKILLGGKHNISNSLAAVSVALELGIDLKIIKRALATYLGTQRRLQIKSDLKGVLVIDDYAHHPTEIRSTLAAIANLKHKRIIVIFQPHRYTRTKLLLDEFAQSFELADQVIITDIYAAGEEPIKGVDAKGLADRLKAKGKKKVTFLPKSEISEFVFPLLEPEDIVITLGAGDINRIGEELTRRIKKIKQDEAV